MQRNFSRTADLNLTQKRFSPIFLKTIVGLIVALFSNIMLVTENSRSACAEETELRPFPSSESAQKTNTKNQKGNPQIIMSVPPEWAETYKQEMAKSALYDAHEKKGNEYMKEGKYDLALAEFQTTLQLSGKYDMIGFMSAHENLVRAYEALEEYQEALEHLAIVIRNWQSDFTRPKAEQWKNALEAAAQGHFDQAVQIYETLLAKAEDWERPQIRERLEAMRLRDMKRK